MEKLQAAIEKARAQRSGEPQQGRPRSARTKPEPVGLGERWGKFGILTTEQKVTKKRRLFSLIGGKEAGPYDMLRTRILQQTRANGWKRVAIVSPHSDCGKTTTTANLIFSFARQRDVRTMVLDLDLRRAELAEVLGQKHKTTMADVFEGRVDFADHGLRYGDNVVIGLNGHPVSQASEILQSRVTAEKLQELESIYAPDVMIFDMPPLLAADDNFGFLGNVDCAILLAEAERTTVDEVDTAERELAALTNVMGIVLNKSRFQSGAYGYGYDYA